MAFKKGVTYSDLSIFILPDLGFANEHKFSVVTRTKNPGDSNQLFMPFSSKQIKPLCGIRMHSGRVHIQRGNYSTLFVDRFVSLLLFRPIQWHCGEQEQNQRANRSPWGSQPNNSDANMCRCLCLPEWTTDFLFVRIGLSIVFFVFFEAEKQQGKLGQVFYQPQRHSKFCGLMPFIWMKLFLPFLFIYLLLLQWFVWQRSHFWARITQKTLQWHRHWASERLAANSTAITQERTTQPNVVCPKITSSSTRSIKYLLLFIPLLSQVVTIAQ